MLNIYWEWACFQFYSLHGKHIQVQNCLLFVYYCSLRDLINYGEP